MQATQRWLASVILAPEKLDDPRFWPEVESVIKLAPCARAIERLRAYTNGLPARIFDALADDYPALRHVVGHAPFHALVRRYVPAAPAGIYNLNDVGSSLAAFLATDVLAETFPFVGDLARLEHALRLAFHAREEPPLDPATLAAWTLEDWGSARLVLQRSVALVSSRWPIRDLWAARETPIEDIDIALEHRPQHVLVHRSGYRVVCETLESEEAWALERVLARRSLGGLAEDLIARGGDGERVGAWFAGWHARALVVACERAA